MTTAPFYEGSDLHASAAPEMTRSTASCVKVLRGGYLSVSQVRIVIKLVDSYLAASRRNPTEKC
jgi:hypothetical protein